MKYGAVGPVATWFPEKIETNEDLQAEYPSWDMAAICAKTGICQRHIAAPDECSSDLGVKAAEKLFTEFDVDPRSIDYLLFCTQTPDYPLPTTACLMQDRLGLRTNIGALDFNLGCSGYVYGLSLADSLIRSGSIGRCLLITAETYTKLIDKGDRSLRTIFGDAAAATIIDACDEPSLSCFKFGTDGSGADTLIVNQGGYRPLHDAIRPRHRHRWKSQLYMDGPSLISFTVAAIPEVMDEILACGKLSLDEVDLLIMHQATDRLLRMLQQRIGVDDNRLPVELKDVGNTVSSTIPILIERLREAGRLTTTKTNMMLGFGVGWSWAGCLWQDIAGQT